MIRALGLVVLGAAAFAAVYYFAGPDQTPEIPPAATDAGHEATAPSTAASDPSVAMPFELRPGSEAVPNAITEHAVRNVTPDYITAGPRVTGTLARVAPPAEPEKAQTARFFNAIIISAGVIKLRGEEVHLAGIAAPAFDDRCGEGAAAWPCGRMARAALRSFLRGRAVECEIPAGEEKLPDPANCSVGGESISEWLVAQGWAKRSGDLYADAEAAAREAKLGLWSDARPDGQSEVATSG
jgi:endonuclease YncB( thermonuclease family)